MKCILWIERHELGPRLHLFGRRIHEFQAGFTILAVYPVGCIACSAYFSPWTAVTALVGLWLVAKDWPDLFPGTRDTASWRFGIHRLPREGKESSNRAAIAAQSTTGPATPFMRFATLHSTAVQDNAPSGIRTRAAALKGL